MRIFHVSEEDDIHEFQPRIPTRQDLDQSKGLVWAVNETCLPNFLTPRNCPRVCFHVGPNTSDADKQTYLSSSCQHAVVIENRWFETITKTKLYLNEFDPIHFKLQDDNAGYYVSDTAQVPIKKIKIDHPIQELFRRQVEVRFVDQLWDIHDEIQHTTFHWSMCRMKFAVSKR
ncbi:DUF6886 family protein [Bacillus sp. es.036]|uniref:DUF6886 family protein n=1 Tax=Bacillus sp. es.036 TaxID=1761764 RepID=UPI000BF84A47|nr:DUF6886 family protein [Bacillus sp. es.036]PFG13024.1 hypothetical protein ATG70_1213 [Bacillus sp. es.036]